MNAFETVQNSGIEWPDLKQAQFSSSSEEEPMLFMPSQELSVLMDSERQLANSVTPPKAVLSELRRQFVMPTDSSVLKFLADHRAIAQILLESAPKLRVCFGADSVFTLKAPIDESGSRTLYAVAIWPGTVHAVRDALEKFDDSWWIANSQRASGYLAFTYELV